MRRGTLMAAALTLTADALPPALLPDGMQPIRRTPRERETGRLTAADRARIAAAEAKRERKAAKRRAAS